MTAWAVDEGKSLFELLTDIYGQFGFYKESLISITKKGAAGAEEIQAMMKKMRSAPPEKLGGSKVTTVLDYDSSTRTDILTGTTYPLDFPKSNVLQYLTEDGSKISARPSGTEPKIKFYFSVRTDLEKADDFDITESKLHDKIESIIEELGLK
jgi:phosphoglucomutase